MNCTKDSRIASSYLLVFQIQFSTNKQIWKHSPNVRILNKLYNFVSSPNTVHDSAYANVAVALALSWECQLLHLLHSVAFPTFVPPAQRSITLAYHFLPVEGLRLEPAAEASEVNRCLLLTEGKMRSTAIRRFLLLPERKKNFQSRCPSLELLMSRSRAGTRQIFERLPLRGMPPWVE